MASQLQGVRPPQLPQSLEDLDKQRKVPRFININDLIEEIHRTLWSESDQYRLFHEAVWDPQAVEGDCDIDDYKAAEMIRDYAKEHQNADVAKCNLATVVKCMRVIMRRYKASRRERRYEVQGENVKDDNGEA